MHNVKCYIRPNSMAVLDGIYKILIETKLPVLCLAGQDINSNTDLIVVAPKGYRLLVNSSFLDTNNDDWNLYWSELETFTDSKMWNLSSLFMKHGSNSYMDLSNTPFGGVNDRKELLTVIYDACEQTRININDEVFNVTVDIIIHFAYSELSLNYTSEQWYNFTLVISRYLYELLSCNEWEKTNINWSDYGTSKEFLDE